MAQSGWLRVRDTINRSRLTRLNAVDGEGQGAVRRGNGGDVVNRLLTQHHWLVEPVEFLAGRRHEHCRVGKAGGGECPVAGNQVGALLQRIAAGGVRPRNRELVYAA